MRNPGIALRDRRLPYRPLRLMRIARELANRPPIGEVQLGRAGYVARLRAHHLSPRCPLTPPLLLMRPARSHQH